MKKEIKITQPPPRGAFSEAEPICPKGVVVQQGPCGTDYRYTVKGDEVTPFFSSGGRLPASPWAAAVAGE